MSARRAGFTLLELLIASAIGTLCLAGVLVFFTGTNRLNRETFGKLKGALDERAEREKTLFVRARETATVDLPFVKRAWEVVK